MNDQIKIDMEVLDQQCTYHKTQSDTWYWLFQTMEYCKDISMAITHKGEQVKIMDITNLTAKPEIAGFAKEFIQHMYQYHRSQFEKLDIAIMELHNLITGTNDASAVQQ